MAKVEGKIPRTSATRMALEIAVGFIELFIWHFLLKQPFCNGKPNNDVLGGKRLVGLLLVNFSCSTSFLSLLLLTEVLCYKNWQIQKYYIIRRLGLKLKVNFTISQNLL